MLKRLKCGVWATENVYIHTIGTHIYILCINYICSTQCSTPTSTLPHTGDLCSDPKHHPTGGTTGLDAPRNQTNGASFCATKHKRRVVTAQQQQQNGKSTAAAPSPTIGADKAAIYGHINVDEASGATGEGSAPASGGGRVSRGDRNKFCGSLPNHLDVGPDGEMVVDDRAESGKCRSWGK